MAHRLTAVACGLAFLWAGNPASAQPLPEGNTGIASHYPGDVGIASDNAVIYADDFEGYASASALDTNWNAGIYHNVSLTSVGANVYAGQKALEFLSPQQSAELSNGVGRTVSPELDVLFLRYYSKYDPAFDVVGSSHNGGGISSHYFVNGNATPGVPANGTNKFLVEYECWRGDVATPNPGDLNLYVYQPEQRSQWGDHFFPDGTVMPNTSVPGDFGLDFVPRPHIVPVLGRWYSYELMVKANTPGVRDGRIAVWLDGALIADFPNLRLRDTTALTIDRFNLSLHIGSNTLSETRKWYDNVVAAKSYIGPMVPTGSTGGGTTTDAGATADGGSPPGDAGTTPADGGAPADAGIPNNGVAGGCGCRAGADLQAGTLGLFAALGLLALPRRRRA